MNAICVQTTWFVYFKEWWMLISGPPTSRSLTDCSPLSSHSMTKLTRQRPWRWHLMWPAIWFLRRQNNSRYRQISVCNGATCDSVVFNFFFFLYFYVYSSSSSFRSRNPTRSIVSAQTWTVYFFLHVPVPNTFDTRCHASICTLYQGYTVV